MLQWNVYMKDFSKDEIRVFNVFNHANFSNEVSKLKKKITNRNIFGEELRRILMYYFWSKCEYEVVITSWPPYIAKEEMNRIVEESGDTKYRMDVDLIIGDKVDVYQQILINWDIFVSYVFNYKEEKA